MGEDLMLTVVENDRREVIRWGMILEEMKKLVYLAGPMVAVTLSHYLVQVISLMMVGHLGKSLYLSSTALAISIANVSGFSVLMGMAGALETLSGQAYGAEQYEKIGTQTYTGIFCLLGVCIPLSVLWIYMGNLLVLVHQDPQISHEAGKFMIWLIPALFGYAILQPLIRYYQMQSLILPMLISSCITLCFHMLVCWLLIFKSGLENLGSAVAIGLSMWLNVAILSLYMKYSSACAKTRAPVSMKIFEGIKVFFRLAIPSAVMMCLEWWSFELLVLLSGILPNPQLETSVLSVCINTIGTVYAIPCGLSAAASTRISNELGAGKPEGARLAVIAVMILAVLDGLIVGTSLFASRNVFGYVFSNVKEVVAYVKNMAPFVCLSVTVDGIQGALLGITRGCGWQDIGVYVNLAAYYLFGIPISAVLCFKFDLRGKGLWIGILSATTLQTVMLAVVTSCANWNKQAAKARERLSVEKSSFDDRVA